MSHEALALASNGRHLDGTHRTAGREHDGSGGRATAWPCCELGHFDGNQGRASILWRPPSPESHDPSPVLPPTPAYPAVALLIRSKRGRRTSMEQNGMSRLPGHTAHWIRSRRCHRQRSSCRRTTRAAASRSSVLSTPRHRCRRCLLAVVIWSAMALRRSPLSDK